MCTSIHHLSCERTALKTPFVACFIGNGPKEAAALDRASRRHESIYLEFPIQFDFERRLPLPLLLLRIPMSEGHAPAADSDSKNPWRGRAAHERAGGLLMRLRLEVDGWQGGRRADHLSPPLSRWSLTKTRQLPPSPSLCLPISLQLLRSTTLLRHRQQTERRLLR